MIEFDQVTTRGGDKGESSLNNGERLRKDDAIFTALGDIDELSSSIGVAKAALARDFPKEKPVIDALTMIQEVLVRLAGQVATPETDPLYKLLTILTPQDVARLEKLEKQFMKGVTIGGEFVLPGSSLMGAYLDVSRAVCRRAERAMVTCIRDRGRGKLVLCQNYLNRLSDLLFVLARRVEQ